MLCGPQRSATRKKRRKPKGGGSSPPLAVVAEDGPALSVDVIALPFLDVVEVLASGRREPCPRSGGLFGGARGLWPHLRGARWGMWPWKLSAGRFWCSSALSPSRGRGSLYFVMFNVVHMCFPFWTLLISLFVSPMAPVSGFVLGCKGAMVLVGKGFRIAALFRLFMFIFMLMFTLISGTLGTFELFIFLGVLQWLVAVPSRCFGRGRAVGGAAPDRLPSSAAVVGRRVQLLGRHGR